MDDHKNNCAVCGKPIVYAETLRSATCSYCGRPFEANALCEAGHYVCDGCHSLRGNDLIEKYCLSVGTTNPLETALALMRSSRIKMHGPEHHFLVPAVILKAYYNALNIPAEAESALRKARQRSEKVLGGFCGFYGDCGAAVGTGIAVSVITGATPLSRKEWRQSNLMTAKSLLTIAHHGGPRCCKRNSFLAIREAVGFIEEELGVILTKGEPKCEFSHLNGECLEEDCLFYGGEGGTRPSRDLPIRLL